MKKTPTRMTSRKTGLAFAFAMVCGLIGSTAHAQWAVIDPTEIAANAEEFATEATRWASTIEKYGQDITQYTNVLNHYEQQLIKLQNLNLSMIQLSNEFPRRDDSWGVIDTCGSNGGGISGILTGLLPSILPAIGDNVGQTQKTICVQIVQAQNRKYNSTVDLLTTLTQQQSDLLNKIEAQRNNMSTGQGDLAANDNEVARFQAKINMELQFWQTNQSAYDSFIDSLKRQQSNEAKKALTGSSIIGQVINAAALQTALQ